MTILRLLLIVLSAWMLSATCALAQDRPAVGVLGGLNVAGLGLDGSGAAGLEPGERKAAAASLLPMYEAPPRPNSVEPAGRYAVVFKWNDGHSSGIYSWDFLRRNCQCEECRQSRS